MLGKGVVSRVHAGARAGGCAGGGERLRVWRSWCCATAEVGVYEIYHCLIRNEILISKNFSLKDFQLVV